MKKHLLIALTALLCATLPACHTSSIAATGGSLVGGVIWTLAGTVAPAAEQAAASYAVTKAIDNVSPEKQQTVANYTFRAAAALRSLAAGETPTPTQVHDTIARFVGETGAAYIAPVANKLSDLWSSAYAKLATGKTGTVLATLEALARGVEAGASKYLPAKVAGFPDFKSENLLACFTPPPRPWVPVEPLDDEDCPLPEARG